jgi:hypothetical protein
VPYVYALQLRDVLATMITPSPLAFDLLCPLLVQKERLSESALAAMYEQGREMGLVGMLGTKKRAPFNPL